MKFTALFLSSIILLLTTQMVFAQLYIDAEGNGGLGIQTSPHARMKIVNSTELTALRIENKKDTSVNINGVSVIVDSMGQGAKLGFYSEVNQKSTSSNSSETIAFKAFVRPAGMTNATGFLSVIEALGKGTKTGISTTIDQSSDSYGYSSLNGVYNNLTQNGPGYTHGFRTDIQANGTGNTYGNLISTSGSGYHYGVHASINGANGLAGYFDGNVEITGNLTWASDEKLKENVKEIQGALVLINQIKPKSYKFKKFDNYNFDTNKTHYGFLAGELEDILPEVVSTVKHAGRLRPKRNNGNGKNKKVEFEQLEPDEDIKAVNYVALIPILTQAIKEQQAIIEDLEKRLEKVEKR